MLENKAKTTKTIKQTNKSAGNMKTLDNPTTQSKQQLKNKANKTKQNKSCLGETGGLQSIGILI